MIHTGKFIDLTGQRFGRLVAIKRQGSIHGGAAWLCKCDCGKEAIIRAHNLRNGHTSSCGCMARDIAIKRNTKHGMARTKLYRAWRSMKRRCYDNKNKYYSNYGGRGIVVCEEWKVFDRFAEWALSHGYKEGLTLDRVDTDGNYEPSNCRYATPKEQSNNLRNNIKITFNGETHTISEWADITGIKKATIRNRMLYGWPVEKLLSEPVKEKRKL